MSCLRLSFSTYFTSLVLLSTILFWQICRIYLKGGNFSASAPWYFRVNRPAPRSNPMLRYLWLGVIMCLRGLAAKLSFVTPGKLRFPQQFYSSFSFCPLTTMSRPDAAPQSQLVLGTSQSLMLTLPQCLSWIPYADILCQPVKSHDSLREILLTRSRYQSSRIISP